MVGENEAAVEGRVVGRFQAEAGRATEPEPVAQAER
jgi:hypothetical protein